MTTSPLFPVHVPVVAVSRGAAVESVHYGSVVVLDASGTVIHSLGDPEGLVFSRSSLKPLQALAMLRAGFTGNPHQVTLACASHSGEQIHVDTVMSTLADCGLDVAALQNTPDLPAGEAARKAATIATFEPTSLMQNCSGKHAAMLSTCVTNGWPTENYLSTEHPLQKAIVATVEEVTGEKVHAVTIDGCGAPVFEFSLTGLARAYAHIASFGAKNPDSAEGRIYFGISQNPQYLGGTDRDVTDAMTTFPGLITKDGAEGVQAGAFGDGRAFALKISDGSNRGRVVLALRALELLGFADTGLNEKQRPKVLGHGKSVGEVFAL